MEFISEDRCKQYIELEEEVGKAAEKLLTWALQEPNIHVPFHSSLYFNHIEDDVICYEGYDTCLGQSEDVYFYLPVDLLFSEDSRNAYIKKMIESKKEKELEKQKKEAQKRDAKYRQYIELKKEFEGE